MIITRYIIFIISISIFSISSVLAFGDRQLDIPQKWHNLLPVLETRVEQSHPKMKLSHQRAIEFSKYLYDIDEDIRVPGLLALQKILPKTTIELIMSTKFREVSLEEAEKMAVYLKQTVLICKLQNPQAFDENTSHIIGRHWHEIDYSNENMTWQGQKAKYKPIGVEDFRSLESLKKFIPFELSLPYFRKIYHPQNPRANEDILKLNELF